MCYFILYVYNLCVFVSDCVCVCVHKVTGVYGSQRRAFNPPGYGITGGCEPHNVDADKQIPMFSRSTE